MGNRAAEGALAGAAGATVAGCVDVALVLRAVGAAWVGPATLVEAVAVYAPLGAIGGLVLAALLRRFRPERAFAGILGASAALGASAVLAFDLYDVGLSETTRLTLAPYLAGAWPGLAGGIALAVAGAALRERWSATATAALVAGLAIAAVLLARPAFELAPPAASASGPDIVLIVLDTTRADALSAYGNPHATSPNLDALASEGVLYRRAYAPGTWTPPSHASLFTGVYPSRHRTFSEQTGLLAELPTLAEVLAERGYGTFFVSQKNLLRPSEGWTRGFQAAVSVNVEDRVDLIPRRLLSHNDSPTPRLIQIAQRWLDGALDRDAPFFLFLNLNDPHTRYVAREPWYSEYAADLDPSDATRAEVKRLARDQNEKPIPAPVPADVMRGLRALYDSELAYEDHHLGGLLDRLRRDQRPRGLVVLVTADHGELLGEHDAMYHGSPPFEELVNVPLLLWTAPPLEPAETDDLASLVDVVPTLTRIAGIDPASLPHLEGRDLLNDPAPELVFSEHWNKGATREHDGMLVWRKAAIGHDEKLVYESIGGPTLFSLGPQTGPAREVPADWSERGKRLEKALRARFSLDAVRAEGEISAEQRARLEALGYLH